jgi:hypothetical protein
MPTLCDTELRMIAEVLTELARFRGLAFDKTAKSHAFARAALIDPAFRAHLAEVHRRLEERRATKEPRKILAPIAPLFRDLEREAEVILGREQ